MDKATFEKACFINERINSLKALQLAIKKMEKRENDDDFNWLREQAYNTLNYQIGVYQSDFNKL